eukprot:gene8003-5563_t
MILRSIFTLQAQMERKERQKGVNAHDYLHAESHAGYYGSEDNTPRNCRRNIYIYIYIYIHYSVVAMHQFADSPQPFLSFFSLFIRLFFAFVECSPPSASYICLPQAVLCHFSCLWENLMMIISRTVVILFLFIYLFTLCFVYCMRFLLLLSGEENNWLRARTRTARDLDGLSIKSSCLIYGTYAPFLIFSHVCYRYYQALHLSRAVPPGGDLLEQMRRAYLYYHLYLCAHPCATDDDHLNTRTLLISAVHCEIPPSRTSRVGNYCVTRHGVQVNHSLVWFQDEFGSIPSASLSKQERCPPAAFYRTSITDGCEFGVRCPLSHPPLIKKLPTKKRISSPEEKNYDATSSDWRWQGQRNIRRQDDNELLRCTWRFRSFTLPQKIRTIRLARPRWGRVATRDVEGFIHLLLHTQDNPLLLHTYLLHRIAPSIFYLIEMSVTPSTAPRSLVVETTSSGSPEVDRLLELCTQQGKQIEELRAEVTCLRQEMKNFETTRQATGELLSVLQRYAATKELGIEAAISNDDQRSCEKIEDLLNRGDLFAYYATVREGETEEKDTLELLTQLESCCGLPDAERLKQLQMRIRRGADVMYFNSYGDAPTLYYCIQQGSLEVVNALLESPRPIDWTIPAANGWTLLHYAAARCSCPSTPWYTVLTPPHTHSTYPSDPYEDRTWEVQWCRTNDITHPTDSVKQLPAALAKF